MNYIVILMSLTAIFPTIGYGCLEVLFCSSISSEMKYYNQTYSMGSIFQNEHMSFQE